MATPVRIGQPGVEGETGYDAAATLRVRAGIGEVISPAVALARQTLAGRQGSS